MSTIPTTPEPFWRRLRQISLYPARGAALAYLIALTLASLLGHLPVLGWLLSLIVWMAAYKYAFEILRATADGRKDAPEVTLEISDGVVWRFFALQFVFFGLLLIALGTGGVLVGALVLIVIALMQPGCIISLAIDGSFGRAIDPSTAFSLIARIGAPYFAAFALLFVIQASAATAGQWLATWMPAVIGDLVLTLFAFWGLFAAFHLMGYLVYQYHEELGYEPAAHHQPGHAAERGMRRDDALLDQAQALVRDGNTEGALVLLREEVRSRAVSSEAHELYRRLLLQGGDRAAIDDHARLYLHLLMTEGKERPAMNLLRAALEANPDFVPMQVEHGEQLAARAQLAGQSQLARDTWLALLRAHPRNPSAPRWALEAALLLAEKFGRDADARRLLEQARGRCEDTSLLERIDAALKALPTTV